ncbi:hydroxyectoine utilization dehydratase EutB [Thalassobacillus devorans]|uniref:Hydroxyectoine utilization dehydratase EutB n=1 Tax=Thalassobacillus devorans TaxID=279813 RepID=A0ABQ1PM02_9BACI|nr:hydroxyectoine utilization dehydratase EutB [Thalassobacillus devorans]NIK30245.1 threonine dehydratase [Thalassobacillus devorans]GGC99564.1 hydroxyectoine utilization dehydratase EutB [Thalassobacillus devorans]
MESVQTADVTFRDIWRAKKRIATIATKTPLLFSQPLSDRMGSHVYIKLENMQPTGAFKLRGAANKMLSLTEEERKKGVATFSTGNHGIAVAYVAGKNNIPATVCISKRVPQEKVKKLKELGAHVEIVGDNQDDAEQYCYELEKQSGITVVKPFDDPEVIAGQGTIGLEILEDCPEIDQAIIPLSGGGLLAGISLALKTTDPQINITGVSMEQGAVMHESLKHGKPIVLKEADTLADSLLGGLGPDNRYTFSMVKQLMDESVLVSEDSIAKGIMFMLEYHKMAIEGAAGAGIGWLLGEESNKYKNIVLVISGNNVDHDTIRSLTGKY